VPERDLKVTKLKTEVDKTDVETHAPVQHSDEIFDLSSLVPDDFAEIPYAQQINTKKKAMETFNNEL
jgi:hypothetical protein